MNTELIIWDCDGVLVDSEWLGAQVFAEMLHSFGSDVDTNYVYNYVKGGSIHKSVAFVHDHVTIPEDYYVEKNYRYRVDQLFKTDLMPIDGVADVLKSIPYRSCVASNGPKHKIIRNLDITKLKPFFADDHIFSAHDINVFKPEPDLFLHAAASMHVDPQACIIIEDSIHGVQAAKSAGMKCFAYCNPQDYEVMKKLGGIPFSHMSELMDLLV